MPTNLPADLLLEATRLFGQMDSAYDRAAGRAGFVCNGCEDNCCRTRFYHHTLLELLYLRSGLAALPLEHRDRIQHQAGEADRQMAALEQRGQAVRMMCPLNEQGRCVLYTHRPMICRLHGLPHDLRRPDGRAVAGPGCDAYYVQCPGPDHAHLDRTPLYTAMADLERRLRAQLAFNQKIKLTVAQMIMEDGFQI